MSKIWLKAYLLREQGATRAIGAISSHREGSHGSGICSSAVAPLFLEFHCDSNDRSPNLQSALEARYNRSDGALGSRVVCVRYMV